MINDESWKENYDQWKLASPYDGEDDYEEGYDDDPDDDDQLTMDCGTRDCLFMGYHYRDECFTAEDCEREREYQFWSEHSDIEGLLATVNWIQSTQIEAMHSAVMSAITAMVDDARISVGLQAISLCSVCGHVGRHELCDELPF